MLEQKYTTQEVQAPMRQKLSPKETDEIISSILAVLRFQNLSIRQSRDILLSVGFELEECRPWNHSVSNIDTNKNALKVEALEQQNKAREEAYNLCRNSAILITSEISKLL